MRLLSTASQIFVLGLLLWLVACGTDQPKKTETDPTGSQPAPAETSVPTVQGNLDYELMGLDDFDAVQGCLLLVWPEGEGGDKYLLGLQQSEGPAEMIIGEELQRLQLISISAIVQTLETTYLLRNGSYEISAAITEEGRLDGVIMSLSGIVTITERASGVTTTIQVVGEQAC